MAMETSADIYHRARRVLVGAKMRQSKESWDELFHAADKDRSKTLDLKELTQVLREKLRIPDTTLPDHEIQVVFCEIDIDKTGAISGPEFSRFVSRGPLNPEEEAKLFAVRVKRVHRNLRLGFRNYRTDDAAVRKLFDRIDRGGDGRISMHELMGFVREDLKLSRWDVFESEMKAFYKSMDDNGDGLDANELVKFIRHTRAANGKQHQRNQVDKFSFVEDTSTSSAQLRRRPTYRTQLLSDRMPKSQSAGELRSGGGSPTFVSTPSFVNLGRTRPPMVR